MNQATDETITVGALGIRFLTEASDSNGTVTMFECHIPANARMPAPHSHNGFEETIYGLEGSTTWKSTATASKSDPGRRSASRAGRFMI